MVIQGTTDRKGRRIRKAVISCGYRNKFRLKLP